MPVTKIWILTWFPYSRILTKPEGDLKMLRSYSLIFASLFALIGCQTSKVGNPASPYFPPPTGSAVILNNDLEIPPETARVFLQRGKIFAYHGFDRYTPWCYFELTTVRDTTQTLEADTFEIYKVVSRTEQVVEHGPIRLARVSIQFGSDFFMAKGGSDGPSSETAVIQMWLRSERQTQVRKLVCGGAEENPAIARAPSIDQIRGALGEIAILRLAE